MSLIANGAGEQPTGFYNGVARQSLRINDEAAEALTFTPSSASNLTTWTWSGWVKRGTLGTSRSIFAAQADSEFSLFFNTDDTLRVWTQGGNGSIYTTQLFRDVSAWYHIVLKSSTSSPFYNLYVNGSEITSFTYDNRANYPANNNAEVNTAVVHRIGADTMGGSLLRLGGYIAEVNFIDGTALTPTSFGETKNGVWIAKNTSGLTFGTNGYRLQFLQTGTSANSSGIGADTSGEDNHWAVANLAASDVVPDSPENNWSTLNPIYKTDNNQPTFSEGNLKVAPSQEAYQNTFSTIGVSSGKWYAEVRQGGATNSANLVGVADAEQFNHLQSTSYYIGSSSGSGTSYAMFMHDGNKYFEGNQGSYGSRTTDGQVIGIALDLDNGKIYFSVDGTYVNSGNPASGTNFMAENIASSTYHFGITVYTNGISSAVWNFGQDSTFAGQETAGGNTDGNGVGDFHTAPPSGFLALCSANLPEPTIGPNSDTQSDDHFNTLLWTGNSTNNRTITNLGFRPDWLWIKRRDGADNHFVQDSTRGADKQLFTNNGDDEFNNTNQVKSFDSDGFTLGTDGGVNVNTRTYVGWNWKANGGTTVTNENGSINSTVQANTTAGFSIVTYTGTGSNATIGHGLSKALDVVIVKGRSNEPRFWNYWGTQFVNTSYIYLNVPAGEDTGGTTITNSTYPTNSVFSVGTSTFVCGDSETYVAYCFHEVEGYSRFGKYTGNGVADGPFVYTGFSPAWLMVKNIGASHHWWISDIKRPGFNGVLDTSGNARLRPALTTVEDDPGRVDFLSNGFKIKTPNYGESNTNTIEYIYMAFAEAPFKYANAK